MKQILVINLKRHGDILSMGKLLYSLKSQAPDAEITLLHFKEFEASAKLLSPVSNFISIDRKQILTKTQNPLFSPAFGINNFFEDLKPIRENSWDLVVNFSNDQISTLIASVVKNHGAEVAGITFNSEMQVVHSNIWAAYFNEVAAPNKRFALTYQETFHFMLGLDSKESTPLRFDPVHDRTVQDSFMSIRHSETFKGKDLKIIGVQLSASSDKKTLSKDTLIATLEYLLDFPEFYPVLLIAPIASERDMASDINAIFSNSLVIIESDFVALASVVKFLDALITPDTVTKHIANLTQTPIVEISLGSAPFYLQGSVNAGDMIIAPNLNCYPCSARAKCDQEKKHECVSNIDARDIVNALLYITKQTPIEKIYSQDSSLYLTVADDTGVFYSLIGGTNPVQHLEYLLTRKLLQKKYANINSKSINEEILNAFPILILKETLAKIRAESTSLTTDLLQTLRLLLATKNDTKQAGKLIASLDQLLQKNKGSFLTETLIGVLSGQLDNMGKHNFTQNMLILERLLFELKGDIKEVLQLLTVFESKTHQAEKKTATQKGISTCL